MARGICRNFPGWFSVTSLCDEGLGRHHRAGSRGRCDGYRRISPVRRRVAACPRPDRAGADQAAAAAAYAGPREAGIEPPRPGAARDRPAAGPRERPAQGLGREGQHRHRAAVRRDPGRGPADQEHDPVGGFSSDGSEPSVEAVKGRLDCGAGYEFWLARQALARNPAIKLYGLQWSAPAWAATVTAACGAVRMWATSSTGSGAPAKTVAAVTNHAYRYGPAGLGSLGYYPVLYPSFTVRSPSPARPRPGQDHVREF